MFHPRNIRRDGGFSSSFPLGDVTMHEAFDEPFSVTVADGEVVIVGPDGVRASLTPAAARESARRLMEAAERADREASGSGRAEGDFPD